MPSSARLLDDSIIQLILSKLPPSALARAELVCSSWSALIAQSIRAPSSRRDLCLHRAAAARWCSGRLTLACTISGHSSPVTCMAVLDTLLITGSSDGSARVWDLATSRQLHLLSAQGPPAEAVAAVALPSASLAVTATARGGAVLWRAGAAIRRFQPMPGGRVTSLALTDTQLLLGSTAGVVQSFDLFSGRQQLITRHSSGVACLLTHRQLPQQQQPQQDQEEVGLGVEEWVTLVGCVDGQVSCASSATGRVLWQLPTRYPSKVVSLQLVECPPGGLHTPPMHIQQQEQQQEQQQSCKQQQQQQPKGQRKSRRRQTSGVPAQPQHMWHVLLYVLNARSQVICWQLPAAVLESASAAAAIQGRVQLPSWPLSVCSVAAPAPQQAPTSQQQSDDQAQQQAQQEEGRRQLQVPHNSCTCMLSPLFGKDCLLVGSRLGYVTVAQLWQQDSTAPASSSAAGVSPPTGSSDEATATGGSNAVAGGDDTTTAGAAHAAPVVLDVRSAAAAAAAGSEPEAAAGVATEPSQQLATQACQPSQQADTHGRRHSWGLSVVRHCSNHKLGRMLASRQARSTAAHSSGTTAAVTTAAAAAAGSSSDKRRNAPAVRDGVEADSRGAVRSQEHVLDGCKVCCMQWGPGGQLLLGLGSGHVCCLKFKHPAKSEWA